MSDEEPIDGLGMARTARQESFGDAFLIAIASVAGCAVAKPETDDDSIDWTLSCRLPRRPKIDVQMKTTSAVDFGRDATVSYPFKKKNYVELTLTDLVVSRILVLVTVPGNIEEWLSPTADQLVLRRAAFWLSLAGYPARDNTTSVTVDVPRENLLTPEALKRMMQRINDEGRL
jgi:Domain of unknown function (DUF4365)